MKIYEVGGSVRDTLLGLAVADRDYVVVGATPDEMLAKGFRPVGTDFPVFLHPRTHAEYALARTERKTAPGYKGFVFHAAPTVTLEEDLARRDLTINAMARADDGTLIDPYGGQRDLNDRVLRHVSNAFAEDPVRILRVARFSARFAPMGFRVAPETLALMRSLVTQGEVAHLVPERVWQEIARGLMHDNPSVMFETLRECGALAVLIPELAALWGVPQSKASHPEIDTGVHVMMVVDAAARMTGSLPVRFAALMHDLGKGLTPREHLPRHPQHEEKSVQLLEGVCARLKVPAECRELAITVALWHGEVHRAQTLDASQLLALLDGCDALRRPTRFSEALAACEADHRGRAGFADTPYPPRDYLQSALGSLQAIDYGRIAQQHAKQQAPHIGDAIALAKFTTLQQFIKDQQT